jgi:hypothetical protein
MPITIAGQPGTSPFSPGGFSNVFIAGPFRDVYPQARKGCQWSAEVIPNFAVNCRGSSRHNRGTSLAPNHDTSTNVAVWPDLSPKPAQTPGQKENRPLGGFLSGEWGIRTEVPKLSKSHQALSNGEIIVLSNCSGFIPLARSLSEDKRIPSTTTPMASQTS